MTNPSTSDGANERHEGIVRDDLNPSHSDAVERLRAALADHDARREAQGYNINWGYLSVPASDARSLLSSLPVAPEGWRRDLPARHRAVLKDMMEIGRVAAAELIQELWDDYCRRQADVCALLSASPPAAVGEDTMRTALEMAAKRFRHYESLHLAKGTSEGQAKAQNNADMAEVCERALAGGPAAPLSGNATPAPTVTKEEVAWEDIDNLVYDAETKQERDEREIDEIRMRAGYPPKFRGRGEPAQRPENGEAFQGTVDGDTPLEAAAREAGWALSDLVDGIAWEKRPQVAAIVGRLAAALAPATCEGVEGLRKALEPFAAIAARIDGERDELGLVAAPDDYPWTEDFGHRELPSLGELRKARAALASTPSGGE